ncbi:hypothetical protein HJC23_007900 [Cyclotella cryptica]|uniref:BED-type domain-containing protein n=1 Tax=Cyclotella cryptica TaxID=29204 RepID=A0ABD3R0D7_9STRA|eukprot:CCRYP_000283-RA/>CCRYP_000283-RA protein AED:0.13 eAED:0.13 QI:0/-1/0/1/-1/1/1/0/226
MEHSQQNNNDHQQQCQQQDYLNQRRPSKKPRDERLRSCFEITTSPHDDSIIILCKYCDGYRKNVKNFNPTKCRNHLVMHCSGVDDELKRVVLESSQEFKRLKRLGAATGAQNSEHESTRTDANSTAASRDVEIGGRVGAYAQPTSPRKLWRNYIKENTQKDAQQESRNQERHWLHMWRDISHEISRLRKDMKEEDDEAVIEELDEDIRGLKKTKLVYARLLGMNDD